MATIETNTNLDHPCTVETRLGIDKVEPDRVHTLQAAREYAKVRAMCGVVVTIINSVTGDVERWSSGSRVTP